MSNIVVNAHTFGLYLTSYILFSQLNCRGVVAEDKCNDDIDFDDMLKFLQDPPDSEAFENDQNLYKHLVHFIAKYVSKLYGVYNLQARVKENPGTSFITHTTVSDLAYCVLLIVNGNARFDQILEIRTKDEHTQAMFKKKREIMTQVEKDQHPIVEGMFTGKKGSKRVYRGHGMSDEGMALYETVKQGWRKLFADKAWYEKLEEEWFSYAKHNDVGKHWKSIEMGAVDGADGLGGIPEEERLSAGFCLPGDDDFDDCSPWRLGGNADEENEDGIEDEEDDEEEETLTNTVYGAAPDEHDYKAKYGGDELNDMIKEAVASNRNKSSGGSRKSQLSSSWKKGKKRKKKCDESGDQPRLNKYGQGKTKKPHKSSKKTPYVTPKTNRKIDVFDKPNDDSSSEEDGV